MNNLLEYRERIVNKLLKNGYKPVTDKKVESIYTSEIEYLQKGSHIIDLVCVERSNIEYIKNKVETNTALLKSIRGYYYFTVVQVFLFDMDIAPNIRSFLNDMEVSFEAERKFLINCSVNSSKNTIEKHSSNSYPDDGVINKLGKVIRDNLDEDGWKGTVVKQINTELPEFSNDNPVLSYVIIGINVAVMLLSYIIWTLSRNENLLESSGARINSKIAQGEWWRLVTPIFLHAGMVHLFSNSLAIYFIGPFVEKLYGRKKFIIIYMFAGVCGTLAGFILNFRSDVPSVGASGAIFGLLGALMFFATKYRNRINAAFIKNIIFVIVLNLFIGFSIPNIDNYGHIGGLIGGFLVSVLLGVGHEHKKR